MRKIHCAVFRDHPVASALVGRNHCNLAELAGRIHPGHGEPRVLGGPYVQHVSGRRVVEIIHAVAGVDG